MIIFIFLFNIYLSMDGFQLKFKEIDIENQFTIKKKKSKKFNLILSV